MEEAGSSEMLLLFFLNVYTTCNMLGSMGDVTAKTVRMRTIPPSLARDFLNIYVSTHFEPSIEGSTFQ